MSNVSRRRPQSQSSDSIDVSSSNTGTGSPRPASTGSLPVSVGDQMIQQPKWDKYLTKRAVICSVILAICYIIIAMKITLSTGMVPSFHVSSGLMAFFILKLWREVRSCLRVVTLRFTRQENATVQAFVTAATSVVFSGGFGNYLFAMSTKTANQTMEGSTAQNILDMDLGRMILFLLAIFFPGVCIAIPLTKIMIVDFKLSYPTGNASGHLINHFHAMRANILANEERRILLTYSAYSFCWSIFKWSLTGGKGCGLILPIISQEVYQKGLYFELSATYIGIGMMCLYITNISQLIGGILSWAIMWPFFESKRGDWYPTELELNSMSGLQGYKVFIALATITGEGVYNCGKILILLSSGMYTQFCRQISPPTNDNSNSRDRVLTTTPAKLNLVAFVLYIVLAIISISVLCGFFGQLNWYYVVGIYLIAPFLAYLNAYGCGLTDLSVTHAYGRLVIFAVAASSGNILDGLFACGVVTSVVTTASDLMHDLRTCYLTLTPPLCMLASQVIGIFVGCIVSPCVFWFFSHNFDDLGTPNSIYPVPHALVYRSMSTWGADEFSVLPEHCVLICSLFFIATIVINIIRDKVDEKWAAFIPGPTAMAIGALTRVGGVMPDSIGSNYALDMCVGSLYLFIWRKFNKRADNDARVLAMASGLMCGEVIWTAVSLFLSFVGVKPPFCMKVLSREEMTRLNISQP